MIKHIGLFTRSQSELDKLALRVIDFNRRHNEDLVHMEAEWSTVPIENCQAAHYNIYLEYPSREVGLAFWGDKIA